MYQRLLAGIPHDVPVSHWGDLDEGGFRIAAFVSRLAAETGHRLEPWNMRPSDVPQSQRRPATPRTVQRMAKFARDAGWGELADEIEKAGITAEQEG